MYKHEVEEILNGGKKVRRAAWPKGNHVVKLAGSKIDLTEEEKKLAGLSKNADISIADTLVYCEGEDKATVGYELTHEDKTSQDWEEVKSKGK